jgi:hypothetical protein
MPLLYIPRHQAEILLSRIRPADLQHSLNTRCSIVILKLKETGNHAQRL